MWALKFLTGSQANQSITLMTGVNILGRAPSCHVHVLSPNISKEHAKIEVYEDKLILTDLDSSNGTFVNGVQVKSKIIFPGDKITLSQIMLEVQSIHNVHFMNPAQAVTPTSTPESIPIQQPVAQIHSNLAYEPPIPQAQPHHEETEANEDKKDFKYIIAAFNKYINDVMMPGLFKVAEIIEFKWLLAIFVATFIFLVTVLSSVPLLRILKNGIEQESQRRALTIARNLAQINRSAVLQGYDTATSIDSAMRESGVTKAYIISATDGSIIAPASIIGERPNFSFIHEARKTGKEFVEQINSDTIGALVPIRYFDPKSGEQRSKAHTIVIYDMGSLAVDDKQTINLFIQTFFIALTLGGILFFLMYKIIEKPISHLNEQLDTALKERQDNLQTQFNFPAIKKLTSNINSALNRMIHGDGVQFQNEPVEYDRTHEMNHIIQIIGFPALAIIADTRTVAGLNSAFEEKTGMNAHDLVNTTLNTITDQALKLSIEDLLGRMEVQPDQLVTNELEIAGVNHELLAQTIYGTEKIAYFIVVIFPTMDEEGEA